MAGASIYCGDFEGGDKSGSPAVAVLSEVYRRVFNRLPRSRIARAIAGFTGDKRTGIEGLAESAILSVKYDVPGTIPPEVCSHLLVELKNFLQEVLGRLGIPDDPDEIQSRMIESSSAAKYGRVPDDGWYAYCLHDLAVAFEMSARTKKPVEVRW